MVFHSLLHIFIHALKCKWEPYDSCCPKAQKYELTYKLYMKVHMYDCGWIKTEPYIDMAPVYNFYRHSTVLICIYASYP